MGNNKKIDCFILGHNEMPFEEYEKSVRSMGTDSGAYRDLEKSILTYNGVVYPITDFINLFGEQEKKTEEEYAPFNMLETFSNTIAYLGTFLDKNGYTFDYVNSFLDGKDYFIEQLEAGNIRSVAITTTLYVSMWPIMDIMKVIKKHNKHNAKIFVGGPFVSTQVRTHSEEDTQYIFQTIGADVYVNSSQGEATLVKLMKAFDNEMELKDVPNIHLFDEQGKYTITTVELEDNNLSDNAPDWSLFKDQLKKHAAVRTAISCPYKCSFCGFPEHAGKYQTTDIPPVIHELKKLLETQTVKSVHFVDDTFNIPKERFKNLLKEIIREKLDFKWHSYYRCQFADEESIQLMKESGCEGVFLGIESGSDRILKNMDKAATIAHYYRGIDLLKKHGIATFGSFIVGFPGETEETVRESVSFIENSGLDFYRTQLWYLEPITPIWRQKEKYGIEGQGFEWKHHTMNTKQAADIVDENFLEIKNSIWLPQYNFDFDNLLHLLHRGWNLDQIKEFIQIFNLGIREKLLNPNQKEVSFDIIMKMKNVFNTISKENAALFGDQQKDFAAQDNVMDLFSF